MPNNTNTIQKQIQPYLMFDGRTEEALEFYREALGAEVDMLMRFSQSPMPMPEGAVPVGSENKVMHCAFHIGQTQILASDGNCNGSSSFQGFSLALTLDSLDEVDRVFALLSEGGEVRMALEKTFWAEKYGIVSDRFGVSWMVMKPAAMPST